MDGKKERHKVDLDVAEEQKREVTDSVRWLCHITGPAGTFLCRHDENSQIENAHKIFNLVGIGSYIAIQTAITSKLKISKPMNEVRVMATPTTSL